MKKCVVLLSGGIESSILSAYLSRQRIPLFGLFVNRGQRSLSQEQRAWNNVVAEIHFEEPVCEITVSLDVFRPIISNAIRDDLGVPGRNLIHASLAIPLAVARSCDAIVIGCTASDDLPDCGETFLSAASEAIYACVKGRHVPVPITVEAPFRANRWDKAGVIRWAYDNGFEKLIRNSFSCLFPVEDNHCGTCVACLHRRRAFEKASIPDPTKYIYRQMGDGEKIREDEL